MAEEELRRHRKEEQERVLELQKMAELKRQEYEQWTAKLAAQERKHEEQAKLLQQQQEAWDVLQLERQHQEQLVAQKNKLQERVQDQQLQLQQLQQKLQQQTAIVRQPQVPNISFLSTIGSLAEFQVGDDWDLYQERLGQYFVANSVPEDRWVAVLIKLIGQNAYQTLKDLCDPVLPSQKQFQFSCDILNKQFAPRISVFKERRDFYNLPQE